MRTRVAATAVLIAGLTLGTTGCTFLAPQATQIKYNPSDGVSTTVGDIKVRNAFAITADGTDANLVMVVLNSGDTSQAVEFQYGYTGASAGKAKYELIVVPPKGIISFGNGEGAQQLVLHDIGAKPGALLPVFVQYGEETGATMMVPVLDASLPSYRDLLPSPTPTPTMTPTAVPTPEATTPVSEGDGG